MENKFIKLVIAHSSENSLNIHFLDIYDGRPLEAFTGTYGNLDELEEAHQKDIREVIEKLNISYDDSVDNLTINAVPEIWEIPHIGEAP